MGADQPALYTCPHRFAEAWTCVARIMRLGAALMLDATVAVSRLVPRFERAPLPHAQPTTPPRTASEDSRVLSSQPYTCPHRFAEAWTCVTRIMRLEAALVLDATVAVSLLVPRFERAPLPLGPRPADHPATHRE